MNFEMTIDGIEYSVKVSMESDIGEITVYPLEFTDRVPDTISDEMIEKIVDAVTLLLDEPESGRHYEH